MQFDNSPASRGAAVTPSDSNTLGSRGLWVGTGGNVTVDFLDGGTNIALNNVPSGTLLPIAVTKVYSTGTTASNIVALR